MTCDAFPAADLRRCFGISADLISCCVETTKKKWQQGREHQCSIKVYVCSVSTTMNAICEPLFACLYVSCSHACVCVRVCMRLYRIWLCLQCQMVCPQTGSSEAIKKERSAAFWRTNVNSEWRSHVARSDLFNLGRPHWQTNRVRNSNTNTNATNV